MVEREDTVVLTDEEGVSQEFTVIDLLKVDGQRYAVLLPEDEEDEAIILRMETDADGEEVLVGIEDDDEWEKVASAWEEMLNEDYDPDMDEDFEEDEDI